MNSSQSSPRDDCDALLSDVLPLTERFLQKHREFYPVGAVMKIDGKIVWYGVDREEESPKSKSVIADLISAYKRAAQNDEIRAAIVVYDVVIRNAKTEGSSDAICADCLHRGGYSRRGFFPYRFDGDRLVFEEASATDTENIVFTKEKEGGEPGATDNPDDARRLREDH